MAIEIHPLLARGVFATYGYFVIDCDGGRGVLVDPGAQSQLFLQTIRKYDWQIDAILLTHGHFDHMGATNMLRDELDIPVMAHELSDRYLLDVRLNLSAKHGCNVTVTDTVKLVDGDRVPFPGGAALEVLHVPGHTDDSCAFYCASAGAALVGDTVYEGGPGLTVFPTGDAARLRQSIQEKLLELPPETVLLSGHSRPMTVEQLHRAMR